MDLEDRILYLEDRHNRLSKSTDKIEGELKNQYNAAKDQKLKELKKLKLSIRDELEDLRNAYKAFESSPGEENTYNIRRTH